MVLMGAGRCDCEATLPHCLIMILGEMPEDWKKANVTLIFRKSKKKNLETYEPVRPWVPPCVSGGTANPGNHFQAHEGKQNNQE